MEEQPRQLIGEELVPIKAKPGQVERYDNQYKRNGTVNNFMFFEPLGNRRRVYVRKRRTRKDFAEEIAHLLDVDYSDAEVVVLVMDNLNTHKIGSLYECFPAEQARAYVKRLEIHHTPKHGSWLAVLFLGGERWSSVCCRVSVWIVEWATWKHCAVK